MAASIIHVGTDSCHRVAVLESAGYTVIECSSVSELRQVLAAYPPPDAFVLTNQPTNASRYAIQLARVRVELPLILFGDANGSFAGTHFQLTIPNFSPPAAWLAHIAAVIASREAAGICSQRMGGTANSYAEDVQAHPRTRPHRLHSTQKMEVSQRAGTTPTNRLQKA